MPASNYANQVLQAVSLTASGAVTKERFIKPSGAQCGLGQKAVGVSAYSALTTEDVTAFTGIVRILAGDTITQGNPVMSDADGKAIPYVEDSAGGNQKNGIAFTAGTNGNVMLVQTSV